MEDTHARLFMHAIFDDDMRQNELTTIYKDKHFGEPLKAQFLLFTTNLLTFAIKTKKSHCEAIKTRKILEMKISDKVNFYIFVFNNLC